MGKLVDELREESEELRSQLKQEPEKLNEFEEVSQDFLPPEVSQLVVDFKNGEFNYEDYFRLSTESRQLFEKYLSKKLNVDLKLRKPA